VTQRPDTEPLPDDLAQLLAHERERPQPERASVERAATRLGAELGIPIALSPSSSGSSDATRGSPGSRIAAHKALGTAKLVTIVVAAFVAGGVTGVTIHSALAPAPRVRVVERRVVVREAAAPPAIPAQPATPEPQPVTPAISPERERPPTRRPSSESASRDTSLAAERHLLEIARAALARGRAPEALDALATHRARFADGQLSEERDALRVQALASAGRDAEARAAAAAFRARYPHSMFEAVVRAALGGTR